MEGRERVSKHTVRSKLVVMVAKKTGVRVHHVTCQAWNLMLRHLSHICTQLEMKTPCRVLR